MRLDKGEIRRSRANELEQLATVLLTAGFIVDGSPLSSASGRCRNNQLTGIDPNKYRIDDLWGYRIDSLQFVSLPDPALHKACPHDAQDVRLTLSIDLVGFCIEEKAQQDPFLRLAIDAQITGYTEYNNDLRAVSCCWHLDRHITDAGSKEPEFVHPHYHFQYGGHHAWELTDFGQQLLLEGPRLVHPPLDGILAVDFVISNYYGQKWRDLRSTNVEYERLIIQSQYRCWRAYAAAVASAWPYHQLDTSWEAHLLWPHLLPDAFTTRF